MANFRYGGGSMAPDISYDYSSTGSAGGGLDYGSIFKSALGGTGGGNRGGGGYGMSGGISASGRAPMLGGPGGMPSPRPISQYEKQLWANNETMRMQQAQIDAQQGGAMDIARMNAGVSLAGQMMQLEAARQERLAMMQDNEKNRQAQMEMQRRGFGADDYASKQDYFLRYGIS